MGRWSPPRVLACREEKSPCWKNNVMRPMLLLLIRASYVWHGWCRSASCSARWMPPSTRKRRPSWSWWRSPSASTTRGWSRTWRSLARTASSKPASRSPTPCSVASRSWKRSWPNCVPPHGWNSTTAGELVTRRSQPRTLASKICRWKSTSCSACLTNRSVYCKWCTIVYFLFQSLDDTSSDISILPSLSPPRLAAVLFFAVFLSVCLLVVDIRTQKVTSHTSWVSGWRRFSGPLSALTKAFNIHPSGSERWLFWPWLPGGMAVRVRVCMSAAGWTLRWHVQTQYVAVLPRVKTHRCCVLQKSPALTIPSSVARGAGRQTPSNIKCTLAVVSHYISVTGIL